MRGKPGIRRFLAREDGSLLVFFMVSVLTVLGIIALSFDLGRRAATQTDLQAIADNVVLAAAGELTGATDAIANATRAADAVILAANSRLIEGTAGQDYTVALDQIRFYRDLPPRDGPGTFDPDVLRDSSPGNQNFKYALPLSDLGGTPDPAEARYVGVRLRSVDVPWLFAGVFSESDLPDASVGAVSVAGLAAWTCDQAPLLFCLPTDTSGAPLQLGPGQGALLRTSQFGQIWREGEFGNVDVDLDPTGACAGVVGIAARLACMGTIDRRRAACFQPRRADAQTGQRPFPSTGTFDMAFDIFDGPMDQFINDPDFAAGPNILTYPLDDCHTSGDCTLGFFGDGEWSGGRAAYIAENYSFPGHPLPEVADGTFFDFPEGRVTRYGHYRREIARARGGGLLPRAGIPPYDAPQYLPDNDGGRDTGVLEDPLAYTTWDDFWDDTSAGLNPIVPDALDPVNNGLASVNTTNPSAFREDRRVVLAGGVHCPIGAREVRGNAEDVEILDYYELFLLSPSSGGGLGGSVFDIEVEVVDRFPLENIPSYREVVQLYR